MDIKTTFFHGDLKKANIFLLIVIITGVIFFLDMFTPVEWAMWLFYTIPLLLASRIFRGSRIYIFAGTLSALILIGYLFPSPPVSPVITEITLFNSFMGIGALWLTAFLLVRYKKLDEASRELDEKFRAMVEDSRVATFMVQDDRFIYVNPRLRELFGYSETELADMGFHDLISPDYQAVVRDMVLKLAGGEIRKVAIDVQGIKKNGELISIKVIGSRSDFNNRPAFIGSVVDMSWAKLSAALFRA